MGQASLGSPGVIKMLESVVVDVTLALPWHLTIPQPDKGKIRRSSLKPEGDLEKCKCPRGSHGGRAWETLSPSSRDLGKVPG